MAPAPNYHFKILVPAAAAGRIIGKGGTTIAQLQKDAGARVKMSKASEFYPGTTERVCLISGPIEGILKINDFFMENFSSASIKILVPNSTAGMIIGKGGSYIKQIKEESGAYVQISQKCTDFSLPERCVTVVGELENIRKACSMILDKIVEDVGSAFRDIRASSMTASMSASISPPLRSPTGSPVLGEVISSSLSSTVSPALSSASALAVSAAAAAVVGGTVASTTTTTLPTTTSLNATTTTTTKTPSTSVWSEMNSAQIIETIKLVLMVSGYGEDAVSEISSAMSTLANYGVLGVGLGLL